MPIIENQGRRVRGGTLGLALLASVGLVVALSACTAPDGGSAGELKSGNEQAAFDDWQNDFTSCMKDEGVDMGGFAVTSVDGASAGLDDASAPSNSTTTDVGEIDMKQYEAASKACTKKLGEMPVPPGMPTEKEMQESMLAFAKCMRAAGYDYPDPEISSTGGGIAIQAMPADEYDPAVMDECSDSSGSPMMSTETSGE